MTPTFFRPSTSRLILSTCRKQKPNRYFGNTVKNKSKFSLMFFNHYYWNSEQIYA